MNWTSFTTKSQERFRFSTAPNLMADNVRAAARGSSSALKTAEGNFDVDHHSSAE